MSEDNLALWHSVEKTDPKHVKPITGKGYSGNSPKPHWLVLKATETFGPCGIGWGFSILDERIEASSNGDKTSFARVRVWYEWNGKRGDVEHVGGTPYSFVSSKGKPITDEDAPKKSVTDALIKALSLIGFAGDIFLGRWDDSRYQAELREEFSPPPARDQSLPPIESKAQQIKKVRDLLADLGRKEASLLEWATAEKMEDISSPVMADIISMLAAAKKSRETNVAAK